MTHQKKTGTITERKKRASSTRLEKTVSSKTKGTGKHIQRSNSEIIGGSQQIDNLEVSVIPVFLKSELRNRTKVNEAFKTHGVIVVKNFLPPNMISILDELYEQYFFKTILE